MSQPGSTPGRTVSAGPGAPPAPLRVVSERVSASEAAAQESLTVADIAAPPARTAGPAGAVQTTAPPVAAPTGPISLPTTGSAALPVVRPDGLPVLAPRPRRRFSDLWRLVFSRRRAGRHRPETTPTHSWSMVSPQRRRRTRRWGRR